ncbi:MAG: heavy-metal-associated domain-containing protein [Epsilonproteobacteria bacterium]|nr:MAG: heavy-metal-associated domain-containing protein [Campylobacterota bacterium]
MKTILILLLTFTISFAAKVAVIHVEGMTCPLCTTAIKKSLKKIDGVTKAKVLLNSKKATVYFDGKVSEDALLQAVKDVGYTGVIKSIKEK